MKKRILTTLCAVTCIMSAIAQIGYRQDDITYRLSTDSSGNHYAAVIGNTLTSNTDVVIPEIITYEGNNYEVTDIDNNAFSECAYLRDISLPNTLRHIGDSAFYKSKILSQEVILPESLTSIGISAFAYTNISEINIPGTIQKIPDTAFYACENLTTANIGQGIVSIGKDAFSFCKKLRTVNMPSTVETIGSKAFSYCEHLGTIKLENVKQIGRGAFMYCGVLSDVDLRNVEIIENVTFDMCLFLSNIIFSENLKSIGSYAFYQCSFENLILPHSLISIGDHAFNYNRSLTDVFIPENVTTIGFAAFYGTDKLKRAAAPAILKPNCDQWIYPPAVCWYEDNDFVSKDCIIYSNDYSKLIYVPKTYAGAIDIPSTVTTIGKYAMYNCSSITEINVPTSVEAIEPFAFYGARGLTTANLPNIKFISQKAFYSSSLKHLSIGEGVDSIGTEAFKYTGLRDLIFPLDISGVKDAAFYKLLKFACSSDFNYEKAIYQYSPYGSTSYVPVFYDKTDIIEDGMILNEDRSVIKYMSTDLTGDFTVPESVSTIGPNAFRFCSNLSSLVLPEGVEQIGENAFGSCTSLKTVHVPASVSSFGSSAFYESNIEKVYYNTSAPVAANKNLFSQDCYNNATLYIPKGTTGKFLLTSPWMYFRNIQEIDFAGIDGVESDDCDDAPVEYYNLQGMKVENPTSGIYIRRQGSKTSKVFIR